MQEFAESYPQMLQYPLVIAYWDDLSQTCKRRRRHLHRIVLANPATHLVPVRGHKAALLPWVKEEVYTEFSMACQTFEKCGLFTARVLCYSWLLSACDSVHVNLQASIVQFME